MENFILLVIVSILAGLAALRTKFFRKQHPNADLIVRLLNKYCSGQEEKKR